MYNDLRYALRELRKNPGFTTVAVLTLALGIGANTAIFSVVDALMLRALPYPEPDRVVTLWERDVTDPERRRSLSPANIVDYLKENTVFTDIASSQGQALNLSIDGPPERIAGVRISANFFEVLGIQPSIGRTFLSEEEQTGRNAVVIVSHEFWQQQLGGDAALVGKTISLDGREHDVVGVLPLGFQAPMQFGARDRIHLYTPLALPSELRTNRGEHIVQAWARLKSGVSVQQAQADLDRISLQLAKTYPDSNGRVRVGVNILRHDIVHNLRRSLLVLAVAVGMLLLIACVNVANLLLIRAIAKRREIAVRVALGASRLRIIRELLTQCSLLSVVGCGLGLVFGSWCVDALVALAPASTPRIAEVTLDVRVVAFATFLSSVTGLVCGLFPALQVSRAEPIDSLKTTDHKLAGTTMMRWRSILMASEVALSFMLLIGAGLLLKSFAVLRCIDLGFQPERVLVIRVPLPNSRYPDSERRLQFFEELRARVERLAGVQSAAFANQFPLRGGWGTTFRIDAHTSPEDRVDADSQAVSPQYCRTLGMPVLSGRAFTRADRNGAQPVAIVSQTMARTCWPNENPLGRRLRRGDDPWLTIVGVVGDIRREGKMSSIKPQVFMPAAQFETYPVLLMDLAVRTSVEPTSLIPAVQETVWALDSQQPVTNVTTLSEIISGSMAQRRFEMLLIVSFAILALVLALVGVYGVVSYAVSQRTQEIGIRIALGAREGNILSLIMGRALALLLAGMLTGVAGAYALSRFIESLLFGVRASDAATYAAVAAVVAVVTAIACYLPARRATKIDPMVALRYE